MRKFSLQSALSQGPSSSPNGHPLSILFTRLLDNCLNITRSLLAQDCLLCAAKAGDAPLCGACKAALPYLAGSACPCCALPTLAGEMCGRCLSDPPAFDRTHAVFSYQFPLDRLLHSYKYGGQLALAGLFADALLERVIDDQPDLVVPMPLHRSRLRERGFNQSAELARLLARRMALGCELAGCDKLRDTPPQAALPWKQRRANVRGAFSCALDLAGKRVALVDDVMTTGATLHEVAKVLKQRGAVEVTAWVVARTLPDAAAL